MPLEVPFLLLSATVTLLTVPCNKKGNWRSSQTLTDVDTLHEGASQAISRHEIENGSVHGEYDFLGLVRVSWNGSRGDLAFKPVGVGPASADFKGSEH